MCSPNEYPCGCSYSILKQEKKTLDPFVMYNPAYATIREEMSVAAYGRDYEELEQHIAV